MDFNPISNFLQRCHTMPKQSVFLPTVTPIQNSFLWGYPNHVEASGFGRRRVQRGARRYLPHRYQSADRRLPRPRGRFRGAPPAAPPASSPGHRAWRGKRLDRAHAPPKSPARCVQCARARREQHLAKAGLRVCTTMFRCPCPLVNPPNTGITSTFKLL